MIRTKRLTLIMALLIIIFSSAIALAAATTEQTAPPDPDDIIVQNYIGISDTVWLSDGLISGDIVKVYDIDDKKLGQATASSESVTVKIAQLGVEGGTIKVSVTSKGKLESVLVEKSFDEEGQSTATLDVTNIEEVQNNVGISDTVQVTGLRSGDIVKVYDIDGNKLGQATAYSAFPASVTVKIAQLGVDAGTIKITVTSRGKLESDPAPIDYEAETQSLILAAENINIKNNAGQLDEVIVQGVAGDVVKVYSDAELKVLLGKATVAKGAPIPTSATVRIKQLGSTAGSVYVTIANKGKSESEAIEKVYDAEAKSDAPTEISVTNNLEMPDEVVVQGVAGDVVKVYSDADLKVLLGQTTVAKGASSATVRSKQLGSKAGSVYVTITSPGEGESEATEIVYDAEQKSDAPTVTTVDNNVGMSDMVTVTSTPGDVVKVYSDAELKVLLGQTVAKNISATVRIKQLGSTAGSVYVTITNKGKGESHATKFDYNAETVSEAPDADKILIINNPNPGLDVAIVYGLTSGDIINVYSNVSCIPGVLIRTSVPVAANQTQVVIDGIPQLTVSGGTVYLTRTSTGKTASSPTPKAFLAE